jgi:putative ABC transport system permease protein
MFADVYKKRGLKPENLSRTLEDSATVTSVLVLAESVLITAIGGLLGMGAAWLLGVQLGTALKQYLPGFEVDPVTLVKGLAWVVALGLAAGAWPAVQAMRLKIVDALRRG